jgi:hypothetical protein
MAPPSLSNARVFDSGERLASNPELNGWRTNGLDPRRMRPDISG